MMAVPSPLTVNSDDGTVTNWPPSPVQGESTNSTAVAPSKPNPLTVIDVAPLAGPASGETLVTLRGAKPNSSPGSATGLVGPPDPGASVTCTSARSEPGSVA